jgi:hypothetical protein
MNSREIVIARLTEVIRDLTIDIIVMNDNLIHEACEPKEQEYIINYIHNNEVAIKDLKQLRSDYELKRSN